MILFVFMHINLCMDGTRTLTQCVNKMALRSHYQALSQSGLQLQNCDLKCEFEKVMALFSLKNVLRAVLIISHHSVVLFSFLSEWVNHPLQLQSRPDQWRSPHGSSQASPLFLLTPPIAMETLMSSLAAWWYLSETCKASQWTSIHRDSKWKLTNQILSPHYYLVLYP